MGYGPWSHNGSDMTERLTHHPNSILESYLGKISYNLYKTLYIDRHSSFGPRKIRNSCEEYIFVSHLTFEMTLINTLIPFNKF